MPPFFQLPLENAMVRLLPLKESDFEVLYNTASDPMIWKQHPNPDRWKREVFENFFEGAIQSGGAYMAVDSQSGETVGSSRFYDYDEKEQSVFIGYTFLAVKYWGKGYNQAMKKLMLDHAFQRVDKVWFHVGAQNMRSRKAMDKLGAEKMRTIGVAYYGENPKINIEYMIRKENWK
jgi:RimJ/RimL family protein N-acetyltransferase